MEFVEIEELFGGGGCAAVAAVSPPGPDDAAHQTYRLGGWAVQSNRRAVSVSAPGSPFARMAAGRLVSSRAAKGPMNLWHVFVVHKQNVGARLLVPNESRKDLAVHAVKNLVAEDGEDLAIGLVGVFPDRGPGLQVDQLQCSWHPFSLDPQGVLVALGNGGKFARRDPPLQVAASYLPFLLHGLDYQDRQPLPK